MRRVTAGREIDASHHGEKTLLSSWLIPMLMVFLLGVTIVGSIVLYVGP